MGNAISQSGQSDDGSPPPSYLRSDQNIQSNSPESTTTVTEQQSELEAPSTKRGSNNSSNQSETMDEFREKLKSQREQRQSAIATMRDEILDLKNQLQSEREKSSTVQLRKELGQSQLDLQLANAEILSLTTELDVTRKQVYSLKEVQLVSRKMIEIREEHVTQLKSKLHEIEAAFNDYELKMMSDSLRQEYTRQLENIRHLKTLYEERARVLVTERDSIKKELEVTKSDLTVEMEKSRTLNEDLTKSTTELVDTQTKLAAATAQIRSSQAEMTAINELSSQILSGFASENDIDLDRLTEMLEENRELLSEMTTQPNIDESCSVTTAALPKTLFDIVLQASGKIGTKDTATAVAAPTAKEIVGKLPKVWRILMEFLNHQQTIETEIDETDAEDTENTENTPSVSSTFIRLKDLILEKRNLQKETNHLKNLNEHLDKRLKSQEKRLSVVSSEVTKTWHLVGRMQRQYRQLHTNEQILRYQLKQKRRMLNQLKEDLEYCRKKWAQAKEKNNESADQMKLLQQEFARRKLIDANTSGESGYSDEDESPPRITRSESPPASVLRIVNANEESHIILEARTTRSVSPTISPRIIDENVTEILNLPFASTSQIPVVANVTEATPQVVAISVAIEAPSTSVEFATTTVNPTTVDPPNDHTSLNLTAREIEYTERRNARLQRLEEQCRQLLTNIGSTVNRGDVMATQLDTIHERYVTPPEIVAPTETDNSSNIEGTSAVQPTQISEIEEPTTTIDEPTDSAELPINLTAREVEYTEHRNTRLLRLEEQCQLLLTNVNSTVNRSEEITAHLDDLHERNVTQMTPGSESNIEDIAEPVEMEAPTIGTEIGTELPITFVDSPLFNDNLVTPELPVNLTTAEVAYMERRNARLRRLEEQSQLLLATLNSTVNRSDQIATQLDTVHERYENSQNNGGSQSAGAAESNNENP